MREITTSNFEFQFAEIESALRSAQLIAFETRYSGIVPEYESNGKRQGFATPQDLYLHIRQNIKTFVLIQFGLTTFMYNAVTNKYTAWSYNFHVYPRSVASLKKEFDFDTSIFGLLGQTGFDLNKCIYKGVNYLSHDEETVMSDDLLSGALLTSGDRGLSQEEEADIQAHCSRISQWEITAKEGDELELDEVDYTNKLAVYLLNKEIQKRFHTVWTSKGTYDTIVVRKVSDLNRTSLESRETTDGTYESDVMSHYVGLSRVWKLMVELKRPIVGCSPLVDLMMVFQELHKPLPDSYVNFKSELHALLPHIYDSKHVSFIVQDICLRDHIDPAANGLAILHQYYQQGQSTTLPLWEPAIELARMTSEAKETIREEAGWDSFYTGSCFIRMAHFLAQRNGFQCEQMSKPMLVSDLFKAGVKLYKNNIHIAPAAVSHMVVDGVDPIPEQPHYLLLTKHPTRSARTILRDLLPLVRGSVQAMWLGPHSVRILVNSAVAARAVMERGDHDVDMEVKPDVTRLAIIGAAVGMTGVSIWLLVYNK